MSAAVDVANIASANNNANSPAGNVTLGASDNFLALLVGSDNSTAAAAPTTLTVNGVSALSNLIVSNTFTSNGRFTLGAYYLTGLPTGSALAVVCTTPNSNTAIGWVAVPMSGVNTASPIGNTNSATGSTGTPSVTATGAGANDIYLGSLITRASSITPPGGNQTNLKNIGPLNSPTNTLDALSVDSILGINSGAFSWTNTATDTVRLAFAIKGLASGVNPDLLTQNLAGNLAQNLTKQMRSPAALRSGRKVFLPPRHYTWQAKHGLYL
jgi:hypothetical protein